MSQHREESPISIIQTVAWCIVTPVLSVWALVSLLPMVSVIRAWGDVGQVLIALGFLATGAVGLAAVVLAYRFFLWANASRPVVSSKTRTVRAVLLSAYAVIWLALYAL